MNPIGSVHNGTNINLYSIHIDVFKYVSYGIFAGDAMIDNCSKINTIVETLSYERKNCLSEIKYVECNSFICKWSFQSPDTLELNLDCNIYIMSYMMLIASTAAKLTPLIFLITSVIGEILLAVVNVVSWSASQLKLFTMILEKESFTVSYFVQQSRYAR